MMDSNGQLLEVIQAIIADHFYGKKESIEICLVNNLNCALITCLQSEKALLSSCRPFLVDALNRTKYRFYLELNGKANEVELSIGIDDETMSEVLSFTLANSHSGAHLQLKKLHIVDLLTDDEALFKGCITLASNPIKKHELKFMLFNNIAKGCVQLEDARHLEPRALLLKLSEDNHTTHLKLCSFDALANLDMQQKYSNRLLVWPFFDTDLIDLLLNIPTISRLSILVADDSLPSQIATKVMLEMLGCVVTCVENGNQALELASVNHFDVLLLDEKMPGMFGSEVIECLSKQNTPNNNTPKVVLTGITDNEQINALFDKGATHYLQKPVTKAVLEKFINPWQLT